MAIIPQQVKCDICGKQKGEINHWWQISVDGGLHLDGWGEGWEVADQHLCGQECVIQAVNKFMSDLGGK